MEAGRIVAALDGLFLLLLFMRLFRHNVGHLRGLSLSLASYGGTAPAGPLREPPAAARAAKGVDPILREAVDELLDGLVVYGTGGEVIFANDAARDHFGVRLGDRLDVEHPSLGGARVFRPTGEEVARDETIAIQILRHGERMPPASRVLRYPDGRTLKVQVAGAPLYCADGTLHGAVCMLHDLHARLQEERDRMELWRGELLRRMAGGIAHDYNNFLTVILGNISLAREAASDRPELAEMLAAAEQASAGAKYLTRQLLAISRGDALAPGTSDVAFVLAHARRRVVTDRRVRCDVSIPQGLPSVAMAAETLQQVLEEILITAAGSMPSGGTVRVEAQAVAEGIILSISDEGAGFPEGDLPHVFDPYFTSWHSGHGLGLASSRATVERHGGAVAVESAPGIGTTFRLRLPVRQGPAQPAAQTGAAVRRVLLMDDDPGVLMVAERMLQRLGHDVVTAVDGDDALRQFIRAEADATPVDLAILDLTVPGGTGGEVAARRIRELSPDVPLIVSSGYASGDVLTHYERYGFSGVILKPYRMEELAKGLAQVVPQAERRMEQPKLWD